MGDVKRYQMQESVFGPFVPYKDFFKIENDYATLLSRHNALVIEHAALLINNNALVEAVAWERECRAEDSRQHRRRNWAAVEEAEESWFAARAEVDRLIAEGEG